MAEQTNVVLFVMDTARADDVLDPSVTPTLADIRTTGSTFSQAISTAPWTLPSHASMITGTYPSKHGAHADHERLNDSLATLPELFQTAGYETVCVSNNTWLSIESGFDRGFESFQQMWQLVQSSTALGELVDVTEQRRSKAVVGKLFDGNPIANIANILYRYFLHDRSDNGANRSTGWIEDWVTTRDADRPFFLLANYLEPHLEYRPSKRLAEQFLPDGYSYEEAMNIPQEPWEYLCGEIILDQHELDALRALYRAEIAYLDEQLAAIREALIDAGEWKNTLLVVTADHGENIGDHGMMDHQYCLYDTLVHVPLVFHGEPFTGGDQRDTLVSHVDLAPTLLDVANIDAPAAREEFQGQSIVSSLEDSSRPYVVSEYLAPQPSMDALERHIDTVPDHVYTYDRSLQAIRTSEEKLIRGSDGSIELYDLTEDSGETTNIAPSAPQRVEELSNELDSWYESFEAADITETVSIDADRKQQLEELGYLR